MKYALVTGACGGMGYAAARHLRDAGYTVFALDRSEITPEEGIIPISADVTDEKSLSAALNTVKVHTEELAAILHFAGIYNLDSLAEISEEEFVRIFDINLFGVYRINKIFLPLLRPGSRIVITTSELAPLDPLPFTGIYAITKAALDKYAYSLRMEVQLLGISVAVLRPGAVNTGMLGVSMRALDRFCEKTELYSCNARRFKRIVESVEARSVTADKIGRVAVKILNSKLCRQVYSVNKNPLLLLLNACPKRFQTFVIRKILK